MTLAIVTACATPQGATTAEKQAVVRDMRGDTLEARYEIHPIAREQISNAAGYAVFSRISIGLLLLSTANGVVHDNDTNADTFKRMFSGRVGVGLGAKDFRGVFVLTERAAIASFVDRG